MNVYDIIEVKEEFKNGKIYNGSEKKFGVTIDGIDYLVKFRKKDWYNVECEYVCSNLILLLGGNAHRVYLGKYNGELVTLCKDFTQYNEYTTLCSLRSISSSRFDTDRSSYDYYFNDVIHLFETLEYCNVEDCKKAFCEMFMYDALLGNTDRHPGNWGLVFNGKYWSFSPIFDNGASLFPRAVLSDLNETWVKERIFIWPNSKIMFDGIRERSSYRDVIKNSKYLQELKNIFPSNTLDLCFAFINTSPISNDLKTMYRTMLYYRYNCIILGNDFIWEGLK